MPPAVLQVPSAHDVVLTAYRWDPSGTPRGIVQLTHGMGEHLLRYEPLAGALTAAGFVVIGQDHRGHGASAQGEWGALGEGGWDELVRDIGRVSDAARKDFPDLPLVLLGHSMGSFAAQQYVLDHSDELAGLVLTGTAVLDLLEPALDLDQPLDLTAFNAPFAPARTDYDWLSRDPDQVDAYVADERCGFGLTDVDGRQMFVSARQLADPERLGRLRADLPVYIAVGEHDPVNGQLALVQPLVQRLQDAGLSDVTLVVYPEARHEVFNETNRDQVVAELLAWLDRVVPPRA